jgi:hypothetical protein
VPAVAAICQSYLAQQANQHRLSQMPAKHDTAAYAAAAAAKQLPLLVAVVFLQQQLLLPLPRPLHCSLPVALSAAHKHPASPTAASSPAAHHLLLLLLQLLRYVLMGLRTGKRQATLLQLPQQRSVTARPPALRSA